MTYYCKYFNPNFLDAIESLGVAPLVHLLDSYGRWPMTVTNWTDDVFDWKKTSAHIRNTLGGNYLINVFNYIDVNDTEYSILYVLCILFFNLELIKILEFCVDRSTFFRFTKRDF